MAELRQYESLSEATDQQRSWFFRYLENGFHASEAARHAKYADPGQSGWENKIRLEKLIASEFKRKVMSADEALAGLSDIARGNLYDISEIRPLEQRDVEAFEDAPVDQVSAEKWFVGVSLSAIVENGKGHLVKEVGYDREGRIKVKLHDALKARDLILKAQGAYKENGDSQKEASLEAAKSWAEALAEARAAYKADKGSE